MENTENKAINTEDPAVDAKEYEAALEAAKKNDVSHLTVQLTKPVTYNNKEYTELSFNFDDLTGQDGLAIEEELTQLGKALIVPALSGEYLIRMAARACTVKIGSDIFKQLALKDYNRIRSAARSFLLQSE